MSRPLHRRALHRPLLAGTALFACAATASPARTASAQPLRDQIGTLFTFGPWNVPLRVGAISADGRSVVPSDAFTARAVGANAALTGFVVNWMTADAASSPLASTGGGRTFQFVGGVPVETRPAPGPIFGERATTLGRGALLAGVNYTGVQFTRVRGVALDDLRFTLTQGAAAAPGAAALAVQLGLDYATAITAFYATAGVSNRVDVGVVVPVVQSRLSGQSTVQVQNGGTGASATVIGGTVDAPVLSSQQTISGRATGLGDVALRAKVNLVDRPAGGLALLGDVRLPTGDAANLLGSGATAVRVLAVYSGRYGALTPYANAGYLHFASTTINDAFLGTAGVDADMAPWATVSLSVVGQRLAGASAYQLPQGPNGTSLTNIPVVRDDALSTSIGAKLGVGGARVTLNVLAPVTRGGPRPDVAYTVGVERVF